MTLSHYLTYFLRKWTFSILFWLVLDLCSPSLAQIIPDQTLNNENSTVIPQQLFDRIDGGALRGSNLFHSFQEFNINLGQSIYFTNPDSVINILTRVTGNNPSNIFGTLGVLGPANFYLINPHGIIFGNNARLDIQGSFTATTTPAIRIGDQLFSAINPDTSALLNIQPEVLFPNSLSQLANITNNGNLSVNQGQNITLIGNTITQNGLLKAPAGEIQLIGDKIVLTSLSQTDTSSPNFGGKILLGGDKQGTGNSPLASILEIAPNATISASASDIGDGGQVILWSNQLTRFSGSISAQGGENGGNGGFVEVSGKNNLIFQGNVNTLAPFGTTGTLLIDPTDIVILSGVNDGNDNGSSSLAFGDNLTGDNGQVLQLDPIPTQIYESELEGLSGSTNIILEATGNITINPLNDHKLTFKTGIGTISFTADVDKNGIGDFSMNSGDSLITHGRNLSIQGANINVGVLDTYSGSINLLATNGSITTTSLYADGYDHGGDITLTAKGTNGTINILGPKIYAYCTSSNCQGGTLYFLAEANSTTTPAILLKNTTIDLATFGENGQTGSLTLLATNGTIKLLSSYGNSIYTDTFASNSLAIGQQRGGNMLIQGKDVTIDGYQLQANLNPYSVADGGNIQIIATNNLTITNNATLTTEVGESASGNGGSIQLQGNNILIDNSSSVNANTQGDGQGGYIYLWANNDLKVDNAQLTTEVGNGALGNGGSIQLQGNNVLIDTSSSINASTQGYGQGGFIYLWANNDLKVDNSSSLNASTQGYGQGGYIYLWANDLKVDNSSSLNASTQGYGQGGFIDLWANNDLKVDNSSSINANTQGSGNAGEVTINTGNLGLSNQGTISASTSGQGNAGNLFINVNQNLLVDQGFIRSTVEVGSTGSGGEINIHSGNATIQNKSEITTKITGQGDGGNITLNADQQLIINDSIVNTSTGIFSQGKGGNILLESPTIAINNNSLILAETKGLGDAGNITINALNNGSLTLDKSNLETTTYSGGNAGSIELTAGTINIDNQSQISAIQTTLSMSENLDTQIFLIDSSGQLITENDDGNLDPGTSDSYNSFLSYNFTNAGTYYLGVGLYPSSYNETLKTIEGTAISDNSSYFLQISLAGQTTTNTSQPVLGTSTNNSLQTAQTLDGKFTSNPSPYSPYIQSSSTIPYVSIFGQGDGTFDYYSFTATAGSLGYFDIDTAIPLNSSLVGNAGNITLNASQSITTNNSKILNQIASGNNNITLATVELSAPTIILNTTEINASTQGIGDAGNILLNTIPNGTITLNSTQILSQTQANENTINPGDAGNITINSGNLTLDNKSILSTSTTNQGSGGDIFLNVNHTINLNQSAFSAQTTAQGDAGLININTNELNLVDRATIITATENSGNAGNILITSPTINLTNSSINSGTLLNSSGQGGNILLENINNLNVLQGSRIKADTNGTGNAGNLTIDLDGTITISGNNNFGLTSGILASSETATSGQGGSILVNTIDNPKGTLNLSKGGFLSARTRSNHSGGSIELYLANLNLTTGGQIIATATENSSGDAGNIDIIVTNAININGQRTPLAINENIVNPLEGTIFANLNNTQLTNLNNFVFTLDSNVNIDQSTIIPHYAIPKTGTGQFDYYLFSITQGNSQGIFDIDTTTNIDTELFLYNVTTEELLASNDDWGTDTGSNSYYDSFINYTFNNAGFYILGVGQYDSFASNGVLLGGSPPDMGDLYTLNVSLQNQGDLNNINPDSFNPNQGLNSGIFANTQGSGNAGQITLESAQMTLENTGILSSSTSGQGNAGGLLLNISQSLLLNNSTISSQVETRAVGNSGTIAINSPNLTLENNSKIEATTAGKGNGGEIYLTIPNQLTINNSTLTTAVNNGGIGLGGQVNINTNILNLINQGTISASTYAQGDANSIIIQANQLFANNGSQLKTITDSQYNAGNINLTIHDSLQLLGQNTGLFASTTANSSGKGGNIFVTAGNNILLQDSASIAVDSKGLGQGGSINLTTTNLTLYNQGIINAETASNQGGNINLNLADLLTMRYGSKITATAGTTGAGGDGGNINIKANFIVGIPREDSDITANAFEGNGGQINITTNGIFGLQFRPKLTPLSDITASSQFGLSGTVSILTPSVSPAQGLTELPSNLVDASQLVGQNACSFESGKIAGGSSFTVTGKGGLPPSPTESLTLISGVVNWSDLSNQLVQNLSETRVASQDLSHLIVADNNLEKQAFSAYQSGNYQDSINLLMTLKNQKTNPLKEIEINRNLALIYQQIGDWNQFNNFLQESLSQLNSMTESSEKQSLLAQVMDVQAQGKLMTGDYQNALEIWQKVSQIYQNQNNFSELIRSKMNEILVLKAMGLYTQANYQINQLFLKNNEFSSHNSLKVKLLTLQGEIARLTGQYKVSEDYLQQALKLSNESNQDEILLSLGNTSWFNKKPEEALSYYQKVEESASNVNTKLQGQLNHFNLLIQQDKKDLALQLLPKIEESLSHLPINRNTVYSSLNIASNLDKLGQISQSLKYLEIALKQAKVINDSRSESYALGLLGHLYEQQKDYDSSKIYTENALILAENLQANDLIYQWQWQMGRINKQLGNFNEAITAYQQSLTNLKSIRADLVAISSDVQFSFREQVEPIYRQLVDLLLQPNATQEQLIQARQVIESLQLAELDNFFRDACLKTQSVSIDQVDPTASIIYTIVLEDRIEVIATLPNQPLVHYSAPIASDKLDSMINTIRNSLTNGRRPLKADNTMQQLQVLYDYLIRPLESHLQENDIKTLVFINDGSLRNIPFSTLYDGQQYLIQKYAVALAPSLQLIEQKPLNASQLTVLTAGLTEARQGFSALPGVGEELQQIQQEATTQVLLNQSFTPDHLEEAFQKLPYSVIHLATHGEFSSDADKTFLLTWDKKLNINQLNQLLRQDNRSIDLLVLSACKTATGDSRATLGLAGMAVRAGAKSTLASLWSVSDIATSLLMSRFYQFLATGQYTKAEAFRQAQLEVLQDSRFAHPYYWSAFVLLGNWL